MACSASTWSRTKPPSAGRSSVGHMLVTIRTRMERQERISQSRHEAVAGLWRPRLEPLRTAREHRLVHSQHRRRTMHTKLQRGARRLAVQTAQGTVEYVALILLVALV